MHNHDNIEALRVLRAPRLNRFFYGKRMDVQHFEMEQSYVKLKQWLLNRLTLGKGVLCGLSVSVDGNRVCVDPGVAIDGGGREITVPVRTCIDPLAKDDGCCGRHHPRNAGSPAHPAADRNSTGDSQPTERPANGVYTLWVCYHECFADYEPILVSDCNTREHCAPGTVVESFCLKTTPGLPPLQGDPDWCAVLWKKESATPDGAETTRGTGGITKDLPATVASANVLGLNEAEVKAIDDALQSRRHALCELFDDTCDQPDDDDPCVPLAVIAVHDGRLFVESCVARPRIYSNAKLLDLILCLAEKIDECCNKHERPVELMRVRSVGFVSRAGGGGEQSVASIQTPLQDTAVDINRNPNSIRIRFSKPFAQDQHKPTTHGLNDADFNRHNVQVVPERPLNNLPYVPGTLTIESPDTIRFDLLPDSPYVRRGGGWQKGRYFIVLRGTENLPTNQQALVDLTSRALDGEPIAPVGGLMSGDRTAGGDFRAPFVVAGDAQLQDTMRVRSIEFMNGDRTITRVGSPLENTILNARDGLNAIRIRFSKPFAQDNRRPTTHSAQDPDFQSHNVQVLSLDVGGNVRAFEPGVLQIDAPDILTFRRTAPPGPALRPWPVGSFRLLLRGTDDVPQNRLALADTTGLPLDVEPIEPANNVMSGNGTAGGDFTADFTVQDAV